ncbi:MAG: 3-keto-5-aminohexanoate cleavage protein [Sphingobium sp.]
MRGNQPVIVEVAISGSGARPNPHIPRTDEEISRDALACFAAGAAIVHSHVRDVRLCGEEGAGAYADSWRGVWAERPDALLYPTVTMDGPDGDRLTHLPPLAKAGLIRMAAFDPGSVNIGAEDEDGAPVADALLYANSYADIDRAFAMLRALRIGASIAIYEPGFLRATLAFHRVGKLPPGSQVKLYFGGPYNVRTGRRSDVTFGLPPTARALDAYLEMLEGSGLCWGVAVLGGDVVECGMARLALERGGHLRVGLEDYAGDRAPANTDLVAEAVALCHAVGRPVATTAQTVDLLGLPAPIPV